MDEKYKRKPTARSCYGHLGGKLGNQLFQRLIEMGWFVPKEGKSTAYEVTEKGYEELTKLGISMDIKKEENLQ